MILEIKLSNFFSIKDEITMDLRAANINTKKAKQLKNNIFKLNKTGVLKSVAVYGANASGKSNIIKAVSFCVAMIKESHNHNENTVFNFIPFKFEDYDKKPSAFFIRFISNGIEYEYSFSLTRNKIISEKLYYYPKGRIKKIFTRNESNGHDKSKIYSFGKNEISRPFDVAENTSDKTLYISRASQMDRKKAKEIFKYFSENFIFGYFLNPSVDLLKEYKDILLEALKIADSDIIDMELKRKTVPNIDFSFNLATGQSSIQKNERELYELFTYHKNSSSVSFNFHTEESDGTQKFLLLMFTLIYAVKTGKILFIDEISNSLHPELVDFILEYFHTGKQSQLIFTTHNVHLLNLDKLRKDQIYFTNKNTDGSVDLYSLYDYKDFRDNMDLEKAYLQGRFDAVPNIGTPESLTDFSDE